MTCTPRVSKISIEMLKKYKKYNKISYLSKYVFSFARQKVGRRLYPLHAVLSSFKGHTIFFPILHEVFSCVQGDFPVSHETLPAQKEPSQGLAGHLADVAPSRQVS